jgi:transposase
MKKRARRNNSRVFKAKVALAAIKGDRTLAQLSDQFDVHANQITDWKDQLVEFAAEVLKCGSSGKTSAPAVDIKTLHAKIGELTLENDFLEAALGKAGCPAQSDDRPRSRVVCVAAVRCPGDQPGQRLLRARRGLGERSCAHATAGRAAPGASPRGFAHAAGPAGCRSIRQLKLTRAALTPAGVPT